MVKLYKIELKKLLTYSTFWVFISIITGLFLLFSFLMAIFEINFMFGGADYNNQFNFQNLLKFPHVYNTLSWVASWFNMLLTLLIIIMVTNEFSYRTYKQHVIDGLLRHELITAKLMVIVGISIIFSIIVWLASVVYGFIYSEPENYAQFFTNSYLIFVYFLQTIAYMSVGLFIAIAFRSVSLSIIIYFGYLIFEGIFALILRFTEMNIYKFLPAKIIRGLTPTPDIDVVMNTKQIAESLENAGDITLWQHSLIALLYSVIFIALSYYITNKRNL